MSMLFSLQCVFFRGMDMFTTTARYALVLAFALGATHFNGPSARAEKCSAAISDDTGGFFSSLSLQGALPAAVNTPDKRIGPDSSFVRFSVRSYFTLSGSAITYSAESLHRPWKIAPRYELAPWRLRE